MNSLIITVILATLLSNAICFFIIWYSWKRLYQMVVEDNQVFLEDLEKTVKKILRIERAKNGVHNRD